MDKMSWTCSTPGGDEECV